jgi:hypothetical protein
MAFNIPVEIKRSLLEERIQALNLEGYQHELNRLTAEAVGNEEAVQQADDAIVIIQAAIAVHVAQLGA